MAKTSWINRNNRKRATVKKYAALRAELKAKKDYQGLSQLPRDASPTRVVNRCEVSGRRRAFIRRFKISRLTFRELPTLSSGEKLAPCDIVIGPQYRRAKADNSQNGFCQEQRDNKAPGQYCAIDRPGSYPIVGRCSQKGISIDPWKPTFSTTLSAYDFWCIYGRRVDLVPQADNRVTTPILATACSCTAGSTSDSLFHVCGSWGLTLHRARGTAG